MEEQAEDIVHQSIHVHTSKERAMKVRLLTGCSIQETQHQNIVVKFLFITAEVYYTLGNRNRTREL